MKKGGKGKKRSKRAAKRSTSKKAKREPDFASFVQKYLAGIHSELVARWQVWPVSIVNPGPSEVTIGLLRRQFSLAAHMAMNPGILTPEVAPILLRCMVEAYIWLAWILEDPNDRAKKFIDDGLGKEKLIIKHRTDECEEQGLNADDDPILKMSKLWIERQRFSFLIDVNLSGSWSGLDTRKMAEESGCRDFYRFTYPMFSSSVHSTWNHISRFDLIACSNPLHAFHFIPAERLTSPTPHFLELAAKYLAKTFSLVDNKLRLTVTTKSTYEKMFG